MLSKWLKKKLKQFDIVNHPECFHNWVHNAGEQCKWDTWDFSDFMSGIKSEDYRKDSRRVAYIYTCTMCGESYWSSCKNQNIPHYRVRELGGKT